MTAAALSLLRAHRHYIAGYAVQFNVVSPHASRGARVVRPGAFRRAIADGGWFMFLNHGDASPALASMHDGTLSVEEDGYGLWFEAALPVDREGARLMDLVRRFRVAGASIGWMSEVSHLVNGVQVKTEIDCYEISLILPPWRPVAVGTWVREGGPARCARRLVA